MYYPRSISRSLHAASSLFPALLVTGPRQVGKTTALQHAKEPSRNYVTLDDPQARNLALDDPALFLQRFPSPVLIDEIQYAPDLLPLIKLQVDRSGEKGGFWLTGSQQFHLMEHVTESLAGRVSILRLSGLSHPELQLAGETAPYFDPEAEIAKMPDRTLNVKELYMRIWKGSFPAMHATPNMDRDMFFSSYVQTYLQRDVQALARVGDEMAFLRFLRACAARTSQLLNLSELARDADVVPNTAKSWLSILEASGLVHLLPAYHNNRSKRLVKAAKLHFLDTGLAAYLTEWSSPESLEAGAMSGAVFESWVVSEILKSFWHNGKRPALYHYRDHDQREVDLLLARDGQLHPIEIKKTASPKRSDVGSFALLDGLDQPVGAGLLLCMSEGSLPLTSTTWALPADTV